MPEDTAALRLSLTDPDAPRGTFTHWLVTPAPGTPHRYVFALEALGASGEVLASAQLTSTFGR